MRQRNVRYLCRMIVKTAVILLPILITLFSVFIWHGSTTETTFAPLLDDINDLSSEFINLPVNAWYSGFLDIFDLRNLSGTEIGNILVGLPLYFIWVEIFDLLLHLIFFFTDLFHKFLGGDK